MVGSCAYTLVTTRFDQFRLHKRCRFIELENNLTGFKKILQLLVNVDIIHVSKSARNFVSGAGVARVSKAFNGAVKSAVFQETI